MGKLIEFLAMPTHCSRPTGETGMRDDARGDMDVESFHCEHQRLLFREDKVECRSCGREWKDFGTI